MWNDFLEKKQKSVRSCLANKNKAFLLQICLSPLAFKETIDKDKVINEHEQGIN